MKFELPSLHFVVCFAVATNFYGIDSLKHESETRNSQENYADVCHASRELWSPNGMSKTMLQRCSHSTFDIKLVRRKNQPHIREEIIAERSKSVQIYRSRNTERRAVISGVRKAADNGRQERRLNTREEILKNDGFRNAFAKQTSQRDDRINRDLRREITPRLIETNRRQDRLDRSLATKSRLDDNGERGLRREENSRVDRVRQNENRLRLARFSRDNEQQRRVGKVDPEEYQRRIQRQSELRQQERRLESLRRREVSRRIDASPNGNDRNDFSRTQVRNNAMSDLREVRTERMERQINDQSRARNDMRRNDNSRIQLGANPASTRNERQERNTEQSRVRNDIERRNSDSRIPEITNTRVHERQDKVRNERRTNDLRRLTINASERRQIRNNLARNVDTERASSLISERRFRTNPARMENERFTERHLRSQRTEERFRAEEINERRQRQDRFRSERQSQTQGERLSSDRMSREIGQRQLERSRSSSSDASVRSQRWDERETRFQREERSRDQIHARLTSNTMRVIRQDQRRIRQLSSQERATERSTSQKENADINIQSKTSSERLSRAVPIRNEKLDEIRRYSEGNIERLSRLQEEPQFRSQRRERRVLNERMNDDSRSDHRRFEAASLKNEKRQEDVSNLISERRRVDAAASQERRQEHRRINERQSRTNREERVSSERTSRIKRETISNDFSDRRNQMLSFTNERFSRKWNEERRKRIGTDNRQLTRKSLEFSNSVNYERSLISKTPAEQEFSHTQKTILSNDDGGKMTAPENFLNKFVSSYVHFGKGVFVNVADFVNEALPSLIKIDQSSYSSTETETTVSSRNNGINIFGSYDGDHYERKIRSSWQDISTSSTAVIIGVAVSLLIQPTEKRLDF